MKPLNQLVDKDTRQKLQSAKIETCQDMMLANPLELMNVTGKCYNKIGDLLMTCSECIIPRMKTAHQLLQAQRATSVSTIPTSLPKLDGLFHGGLPCGTVTEIGGPPGSGKTQFCMTVGASALEIGVTVAYIDTEGAFTGDRMVEIYKSRPRKVPSLEAIDKNFILYREMTYEALSHRLDSLENALVEQTASLVIIDSVASIARKEFGSEDYRDRQTLLAGLMTKIKYLAQTYKIAVLLVNQVTTKLNERKPRMVDDTSQDFESGRASVVLALGNVWAHYVNICLITEFLTSDLLKLTIVKSPLCQTMSLACRVTSRGWVMDWSATGKIQECVNDSDSEYGLTVHSDVIQQSGLLLK